MAKEQKSGNGLLDFMWYVFEKLFVFARKPQQLFIALFVLAFVVLAYFYIRRNEGEHKELSENTKSEKAKTELEIIALKRALDSVMKKNDSLLQDCIQREREFIKSMRLLDSTNIVLRTELKTFKK